MFKKFLLLLLATFLHGAFVQEAVAQDAAEDRKVRIEIVTTENGETKRVTKEFDFSSEQGIENTLKELGVLDKFNIDQDGENVTIDIRRFGGDEDDNMSLSLSDLISNEGATNEPHAFLGVSTEPLTDDLRTEKKISAKEGVYVNNVIDDSPAQKAGLVKGDVIISIDGRSVAGPKELTDVIRAHKPDDDIKVTYERDGKKISTNVLLAQQQIEEHVFKLGPEHGSELWEWRSDMGDTERESGPYAFLGVTPGDENDANGATIGSVTEGTAAAKMGIEVGDRIIRINDVAISNFGELSRTIKSQKAGDTVSITLIRSDKEMTVSGELGASIGHYSYRFHQDGNGRRGDEPMFRFDDDRTTLHEREDLRREMEELRREMTEMRRELRNDLRTETRITIEKTPMTAEEKAVLQRKGVDLTNALDLENMRVFPNPSNGFYRIQFDIPEHGDLYVNVHDASGEKVYEERITNFKGRYERTLDLTDNATGSYFLVIQQSGKNTAQKLIKE